jgi:hypothetical protein
MTLDAETIGPVEYALFAFPGSEFTGDIAPALAEAVRDGTIRIIDLAFVRKTSAGDVEGVELNNVPGAVADAYDRLDGEISGLLSDDDITELGEGLAPGDSGALVVWEAVWASRLAHAVRASSGHLLASGRVPQDIVAAAIHELTNQPQAHAMTTGAQ